jgi:hypothetical protein
MCFLCLCQLLSAPAAASAGFDKFSDVLSDARIQRGKSYPAAAPRVDMTEEDMFEIGRNAGALVDVNDGLLPRPGVDSRPRPDGGPALRP